MWSMQQALRLLSDGSVRASRSNAVVTSSDDRRFCIHTLMVKQLPQRLSCIRISLVHEQALRLQPGRYAMPDT